MNIFFDVKSADKACNTNVINFCLLAEDDRAFYAELNDIENFCDNSMLFNIKDEMFFYDEKTNVSEVEPEVAKVYFIKNNFINVRIALLRWLSVYEDITFIGYNSIEYFYKILKFFDNKYSANNILDIKSILFYLGVDFNIDINFLLKANIDFKIKNDNVLYRVKLYRIFYMFLMSLKEIIVDNKMFYQSDFFPQKLISIYDKQIVIHDQKHFISFNIDNLKNKHIKKLESVNFNSKNEIDLYDIISCPPDDFFYKDVKSYIHNYIFDKYIQHFDFKNFSEILLPILKSLSILSIDDIFCEDRDANTAR
jgi:hypothetical protein